MLLLRMLWTVLMASVVMYGLVGVFALRPSMMSATTPAMTPSNSVSVDVAEPLDPEKFRILVIGFGALSTLMGIGSVVVRRRLVSHDVIQKRLQNPTQEDLEDQKKSSADRVKDAQAHGGSELQNMAAKAVFPGYVASWILSSAAAVHGFALSQMIHKPLFFFWFGVPSVVLLIVNRPSTSIVDNLALRGIQKH